MGWVYFFAGLLVGFNLGVIVMSLLAMSATKGKK